MFGSTWGQNSNNNNNQQQQQPQQQQPTFGQPTNTFGGFGNTAQQNPGQPQNSIFGSTSNTGAGFGGFGATNTNQTNPLMSGFGTQTATQPRFGGFGATSTTTPAPTGSTFGGFGSTSNTGTAFGSGSAFGASTSNTAGGSGFGGFGAPKPAGTFGPPATNTDTTIAVIPNTGSPAYATTSERDTNATGSTTVHYQSITCMPAYKNYSFEELRLGDYTQNRKTANPTGSGFGAPSAFGPPATTTNTGGGLFGQPAQSGTTGGGLFGSTNTNPGGGFGGFGATNTNTGTPGTVGIFGGFGAQNNQQQQPQQQNSMFGSTPFGQNNAGQAQTTGFGAFGAQQQQPQAGATGTGFGAFGNTNAGTSNDANKSVFGGFGANASNAASGSAFGGFGQQPAQQQQATGGVFGQPAQQNAGSVFGGFGATANKPSSIFGGTTSAFGTQQQQPQQQQSAFGNFGSAGTAGSTNIFGQPQPGQDQQQQQQQQQGGGLFGQQQQPQQQQQSNIFGQPSNTTGTGLFGNTQPAQQTSSIFGNTNTTNANPNTLFGAKPAGTGFGLFGTQQNQPASGAPGGTNPLGSGGGLFGNTNTQQTGGSIFGNQAGGGTTGSIFGQPKPGGIFGSSTNQGTNTAPSAGGSIFGNSLFGGNNYSAATAPNNGQQPSLTASIDQPISSSLPIQQLMSMGPRAVPLDQSQKKKSNYFADVPMRGVQPRIGLNYAPAATKLRGFSSISIPSGGAINPFSASALGTNKNVNPFTAPLPPSPSPRLDSIGFGSDGLLSSSLSASSLGSPMSMGIRPSPKKLMLSKKVTPADIQAQANPHRRDNGIRFDPALSAAARERENARFSGNTGRDKENNAPESGSSTTHTAVPPPSKPKSNKDASEGDYWSRPSVEELILMDHAQLSHVENFTVGRIGYGEITFLQPVDLTTVGAVRDIPGSIVVFLEREAIVYPDDVNKPAPGEGLNVPAEVKLDKVWAVDKANKEPIKDEEHIAHRRLIKKLMNYPNTKYLGFEMGLGRWRFEVTGF